MIISVLGCGWFGLPFAKVLINEGYRVNGSTTSIDKLPILKKEKVVPFLIGSSDAAHSVIDSSFFNCDVLVITVPPKVRSNPDGQYISTVQSIIEWIKKHQVTKVMFISSTGVYGDVNDRVDETTKPMPDGLSGKVLLEAESLFTSENSFRTTVVRFGGLIGPGRDPANFFSGKKNIPNGRAPVNLIHLNDCCRICLTILKQNYFGYVINACAPEHPRKMDFYREACIRSGVPKPEFEDELLAWKIVDSIYLRPLLSYTFPSSLIDFA